MRGAQPIGKLLAGAKGNLQRLHTQAETLQQLTREIRQYLPGLLAPHCFVATIRSNRLILHTDTAAHASLLRYRLPTLVKHLQHHQGLHHLSGASIKVRPCPQPFTRPAAPRPTLSPANASLLRHTANGIQDPHLQAAFLRLSRHTAPDTHT